MAFAPLAAQGVKLLLRTTELRSYALQDLRQPKVQPVGATLRSESAFGCRSNDILRPIRRLDFALIHGNRRLYPYSIG